MRAKGADTVITCGGALSNHCRATALAAVGAGLNSTLLLRTEDPINPPPCHNIDIVDGYVGRGYALSRQEELKAIYELAQLEGVVLGPVCTGKAFYGMVSEIRKNRSAFGKRIVFVHTGGLFGLFPVAGKFKEFF